MGALPPITVQKLGYDPIRMGSGGSPIGDDTGDTRPFFRGMRNSTGCDAGQSRLTGHSQQFTTGGEWVRPRTVFFSHAKLLVMRSGLSLKAKLYRRAIVVANTDVARGGAGPQQPIDESRFGPLGDVPEASALLTGKSRSASGDGRQL